MSPTALLLSEIRQTERCLARARALRTTLQDCTADDTTRALLCATEHTISALTERLSGLRYRYRHDATEVRA